MREEASDSSAPIYIVPASGSGLMPVAEAGIGWFVGSKEMTP